MNPIAAQKIHWGFWPETFLDSLLVVQSDYAIVPALLHNLEMPMPYIS